MNALGAIIKYCREGIIVVPDYPYAFCTLESPLIDAMYCSVHYTSFEDLSLEWSDLLEEVRCSV